MSRIFSVLMALGVLGFAPLSAAVHISHLTTELRSNPMDVGTTSPRLGWRIESDENDVWQSEAIVEVASSEELLRRGEPDLWSSTINGSLLQWIRYDGAKLNAGSFCFWRVKVLTNRGDWVVSDVAKWNVGLLTESDWTGQWIGYDHAEADDVEDVHSALASRYFRTEFSADKKIRRAMLYVCGLGLYVAYINGKRVGCQELAPAPTDYRRTALYNAYDVSDLLHSVNRNAIGVVLGCGRFYTMQQNKKPYKIANFGYPRLRLNLVIEFEDGSRQTVSSSDKWRLSTNGPIRKSNEYDGETYDEHRELNGWTNVGFDDSSWMRPERVAAPYGTLRPQMMDGMSIVEDVNAQSVARLSDGSFVVDFGENMAGWVNLHMCGTSDGDTIVVRYAEKLNPDGSLYVENLRHAQSTDRFVCADKDSRWWRPTFTYHGFRFVCVSGLKSLCANDIVGQKVSDAMRSTGSFRCSNEVVNRVYANAVRGIRANYKGMPVDCPQRDERQPWLGDRTMGCVGESFVFDNHALYVKWARDIVEAQREDGCIPDVAPAFWNYYSDNVTWPAALPMSLLMLEDRFDDSEPFERFAPNVSLWLRHVAERYKDDDGLIGHDKYGDWCVPPEDLKMIHSQAPERQTDGRLISSAYYVLLCQMMASHTSGADAVYYQHEAQNVRRAFLEHFVSIKRLSSVVPGHALYPDSTFFGNNSLTSNLLGLKVLGNDNLNNEEVYLRDEVRKQILRNILIDNKEHLSCGVIGISWLMRSLADMGRNDVAWLLAGQTSYPSWGYMLENGATSIWELWNGDTASPKMNSGNHVMLLGDLIAWIYQDIVGIKSIKNGRVVLAPDFSVDEIDEIDGSFESLYGTIVSRWNKKNGSLVWHVEIPANTRAMLTVPDGSQIEVSSGKHDFSFVLPRVSNNVIVNEFVYAGSSYCNDYDANFLECHSASIVESKNGDLVCVYFGGTKERNPDVCIWAQVKKKGSNSWGKPILVADGVFLLGSQDARRAGIVDSSNVATLGPIKKRLKDRLFSKAPVDMLRRKACWNPVISCESNGDLVVYFKIGLKVGDWTGWTVRSKDGGRTWQDRLPMPNDALGAVKNKVFESRGRLIAPCSLEGKGWHLYFELSDDGGASWRKTPFVPADSAIFAIQPALFHLSDGRIGALCRTKNRQVGVTFSSDNGETWSAISLLSMPNNNSGLDVVSLSDNSGHVLVCNPWPIEPDKTKGARTPLVLLRSADAVNWSPWLTLEDSPVGQYSYPSIIQTRDNHLHIVYTWRRRRIKHVEVAL